MNKLLLLALVLGAPLAGCSTSDDDEKSVQDLNVNSRYTIESVHILGGRAAKISDPLRSELDRVVGEKLDHSMLEKLAERIKKELHVSDVAVKVSKGTVPDHVVVNFEITKSHEQGFDLNIAKFLYHSKQGWSGAGDATTTVKGNAFSFGLVSDGDELVERFAGMRANRCTRSYSAYAKIAASGAKNATAAYM